MLIYIFNKDVLISAKRLALENVGLHKHRL